MSSATSPNLTLTAPFVPNRRVSPATMGILVVCEAALALAVWWASPVKVLPRPDEVAAAFRGLWMQEGLGRELWASLTTNLEALGITVVISLLLSYLTVLPVFRPVAAAVSKGRFLGFIGFPLVFTLVIGNPHWIKVGLLVLAMTVFFVTSMAAVILEIPRERLEHARTLRMGEWRVVWEVVVLGTADKALEVTRQNAAIGWMMLTMVEGFYRGEGGVGSLLLNENKHFLLAGVFAIQLTILAVGLLQDYGLGLAGRLLFPWAGLTVERR